MQNHLFIAVFLILTCFTVSTFTFWFLSQVQVSAVGGAASPALCDIIPGMSRRQRKLCQRYPDVMSSIADGAKIGIAECQNQFAAERWNCTTIDRSGFGKILVKLGSREAAFVYAISSAGVVQSIAKACSRGEIMSCSCEPGRRGTDVDRAGTIFSWGGCSDNAVKRKMRLQCKCHGVSGSCTTKTCWKAVSDFQNVGKMLHHRYRQAMQVSVRGQGAGLVPNSHGLRYDSPLPQDQQSGYGKSQNRGLNPDSQDREKADRLKRSDLVFFEPSPDYCITDPRTGSLGTAGRRCNKTSTGPDSCDLLCCGRGYDTRRIVKEEKCQCKFIWCCKVECKTCIVKEDIHTCKSPQMLPADSRRFRINSKPGVSGRRLDFLRGRQRIRQAAASKKPAEKLEQKTAKTTKSKTEQAAPNKPQSLKSGDHHFRSPKLRSRNHLHV